MKILSGVVAAISTFLDKLAGVVYLGLMVLVVLNVILRAGLSAPIKGTFEYVGFYTALAIAFSIAFCALKDGHIAVTFLAEKMFSSRNYKIVEVILNCLSIVFFLFVSQELFTYGAAMIVRGDLSLTTRTPYYPFIFLIAFCFVVLALVLINRVIDLIVLLKKEAKN